MGAVSKAEFARLKGWNRSTVTRYAAAGKIVLTADDKVDVEASDARLAALQDPVKDGVRHRHQRERASKVQPASEGSTATPPADPMMPAGGRGPGNGYTPSERSTATPAAGTSAAGLSGGRGVPQPSFYEQRQQALAEADAHRAALLSMERAEKEGRLVDAEVVRRIAFNAARAARNALQAIRFKVDPLLLAETDPARRAEIWDREIRTVCDDLARVCERPTDESPKVEA